MGFSGQGVRKTVVASERVSRRQKLIVPLLPALGGRRGRIASPDVSGALRSRMRRKVSTASQYPPNFMPFLVELIASLLFALAIIHTFCAPLFLRLAHLGGRHTGLFHWLGEIEVIFGLWACALVAAIGASVSWSAAVHYLETRNFTEPFFVTAIMVVAASRPILVAVGALAQSMARVLPVRRDMGLFFILLSVVPLMGSLITEPAAMTMAALMLRENYFRHDRPGKAKLWVLAVLLVNVSIGGVLSAYAAPPVLMVASAFGWDSAHMLAHFGWRAAVAVVVNALVLTCLLRKTFGVQQACVDTVAGKHPMPAVVIAVHLCFLMGIVLNAHHPAVFIGLLLLFIGYAQAYGIHQDRLMIKEGLLVGFFLAGLVVLGGLQRWWLQDLLGGLSPIVLFWGSVMLTALTDNAALTYLGALVQGTSEHWRYMLVAGAVTGGGLTVIANAPNPAAFAILKGSFPGGQIAPLRLFGCALAPTFVAAAMFLLGT